jgi:SAM-dependent methyltransferase
MKPSHWYQESRVYYNGLPMPKAPRPRAKDWWKTHFDRASLGGYGLPKKTASEIRGAAELVGLRRGADILDMGCGAGRHSIGLAVLGHHVVGLDWSPRLIEAAKEDARTAGVRASFVRGDMRRLRFRSRFDAVVNLFTSFGYFDTDAEDLAVLNGVRRALRPTGVFLIDLLNKQWLLRHFSRTFWQKKPDGDVVRAFNRLSFDKGTSRLSNRRTLYLRDGSRRRTFLRFKVYSLEDMERLLTAAKLRIRGVWGGFDGRRYGKDTFRMILAAEKARK